MCTSESLCSFGTGRERADFLCNHQLLPSLGELTYYANYLTNMAQMSLLKHESGSVSPISIFFVFPVHSQLTHSLVCGKKACCQPQKPSLCRAPAWEECGCMAGGAGWGGFLMGEEGGDRERRVQVGSASPPGCLGTYRPGKASHPSHLFPRW